MTRFALAVPLLMIVASCGSSSTPRAKDGAADSADGGAEAGCSSADQFAASHMPSDPCAVDSDCHDPFLACASVTVGLCRGVDAPVLDVGCQTPLRAVPQCPEMASVTLKRCTVSYQRPCTVATDCAPSGFSCMNGQCQPTAENVCETVADCPQGWDCYAPCPCAARVDDKRCYPPFARFACPACVALPDAGEAGDAADAADTSTDGDASD